MVQSWEASCNKTSERLFTVQSFKAAVNITKLPSTSKQSYWIDLKYIVFYFFFLTVWGNEGDAITAFSICCFLITCKALTSAVHVWLNVSGVKDTQLLKITWKQVLR